MNTEIERAELEQRQESGIQTENRLPAKAEYMDRIRNLPAEDQAFLDGYLFAIVKNRKGA